MTEEDRRAKEALPGLVAALTRRLTAIRKAKTPDARQALYQVLHEATLGTHSVEEVESWFDYAVDRSGHFPLVNALWISDLVMIERVPNYALREAVLNHLEEGGSWIGVCKDASRHLTRLEQRDGKDYGPATLALSTLKAEDTSVKNLRRMLGLDLNNRRGGRYCSILIGYFKAVAITRAIEARPVDIGV